MKDKEKIFMTSMVFLITIVLVALIFVQFKTIDETNIAELENMQEAELRTELVEFKNKYNEIITNTDAVKTKINDYRSKIDNNQQANELLNSELVEKEMLAGKIAVKGEGVIVTLQDTQEGVVESEDLVDLVNELRYLGAQAISINEQRVMFNTYIVSVGSKYISVGGNRAAAPYTVKVIGNQSNLNSSLNVKNSGYVDRYNSNGKNVSVTVSSNIEIPAYTGNLDLNQIYY